ncbi:MAG TPA: ABC transporter permease, partial [Deinococcales bacterium]|nr:ABC transporter permease [Deinococcales bacterium]
MTEFILKRLLVSIPLLVAVTALIFTLLLFTPGDPLDAYLPPDQQVSAEQREVIKRQLGLDQPPVIRYVYWLGQAARLDLGFRYKNQEPVAREIGRRVGPTLMLMSVGIGLGVVFGILFGVIAAIRRYTALDGVLTIGAFLGISTPAFLAGLVGMYLFSLKLRVFPAGGYSTPGNG